MFKEVKKTSAYWNLIRNATHSRVHMKNIGPLKRSDGSLAVADDEKACLNDATAYCIGQSIDIAIAQLNKTLKDIYTWYLTNRLTPHPGKSKVMLLSKATPMGPYAPLQLGTSITKPRLLGTSCT